MIAFQPGQAAQPANLPPLRTNQRTPAHGIRMHTVSHEDDVSDEASYMSKMKRNDSARRSILNAREVIRRSVSKTREKGL